MEPPLKRFAFVRHKRIKSQFAQSIHLRNQSSFRERLIKKNPLSMYLDLLQLVQSQRRNKHMEQLFACPLHRDNYFQMPICYSQRLIKKTLINVPQFVIAHTILETQQASRVAILCVLCIEIATSRRLYATWGAVTAKRKKEKL